MMMMMMQVLIEESSSLRFRTCTMRGCFAVALLLTRAMAKPHILALLVDDYGWADAGWHAGAGSNVSTPSLDALVAAGVELERNYVFQCCSPSRSAAQTGRNPIHVNTENLDPIYRNAADDVRGFAGVPRPMTGVAEVARSRSVDSRDVMSDVFGRRGRICSPNPFRNIELARSRSLFT